MAKATRMITCTECRREFLVEIPPHEVINSEYASMAVMPHPNLYFCSHCGAAYKFFITKLKGVEFGWIHVEIRPEQLAQEGQGQLIQLPGNKKPEDFH